MLRRSWFEFVFLIVNYYCWKPHRVYEENHVCVLINEFLAKCMITIEILLLMRLNYYKHLPSDIYIYMVIRSNCYCKYSERWQFYTVFEWHVAKNELVYKQLFYDQINKLLSKISKNLEIIDNRAVHAGY